MKKISIIVLSVIFVLLFVGYLGASNTQSKAAPSTQSSDVVFSNVTATSMTISWTDGDGANRIVLVKAGSAVNSNPVDGIGYSADNEFESGDQIGTGNYVVYDGSGSTFSLTGLSAATTYHCKVFEYDGTGATAEFNTSDNTNNPNSQATLLGEPSTQASNVTFSSIQSTQMTLGWTSGSGENRLVLASMSSAINADPSDASTYTANAAFGSGSEIGTGNYVVYIGSSTSEVMTSLFADSTYYVKVYEYNNTATNIDYKITDGTANPASKATLSSEPTTQATNITFSSVDNNQMTVNWTRGNGSKVVVVGHRGSAVDSDLADLSEYSANAAFGSGTEVGTANYVVYNGTGTSVVVTSLLGDSTYHFKAYEYNSSGSPNYKTDGASGNPNSQQVLKDTPSDQADNIVFSSVAKTTMRIAWSNGNGENTLVLVKAGSAVDATPSDGSAYSANAALGSGQELGTGNYAVYNGSGAFVDITALTAGVTYHVQIFEYNNSGAYINYKTSTDTDNPNSQQTPKNEPSDQADNLSFSNITSGAMRVSWTNGDGDGTIVLAHSGSAVDANPVDAANYTANAAFGSGEEIGAGNYVVYIGSNSYVDITALSGGTTYHYKAYEYNNSSTDIDYNVADDTDNPNSQSTLAAEPTTQAGDISFSLIEKTQMKVTCVKGNGASRIIVAHSGSAVDSDPVDAAVYTANATLGSGTEIGTGNYVVYSGSDSVVTVTGLSAGNTYHFKVYELNSTGGTNYKVDGFSGDNPNSQITVKNTPSDQADNLSFSTVTNNAMRVSWTNGDGDGTIVLAHSGSAVDANPSDASTYSADAALGSGTEIGTGNYVVYIGTGAYVDVTGLSANTTYHYKAYEYNNSGSDIDYHIVDDTDNPNSQKTQQDEPTTQATSVTFSSVDNNQMTVNWSRGNGDSVVVVGHSGSAVDSNPVDAATYTANTSFGSGTQIGTGNYVVYNGTGTNVTVTALSGNTTYHYRAYEYNNNGSENYKTDVASGNPNSQLTLKDAPSDQADNISFSSITKTTMRVSWTNGDGASTIVLVKAGSSVDATPSDGVSYSSNAALGSGQELGTGNYVVYNGNAAFVDVTALSAGVTYYVQVFEYNNSGANINYNTSTDTDNPNSQATVGDSPTDQADNLSFSNVTNSAMRVSWTNGDGDGTIVLAHSGSAVDTDPVDATTFTANAAFGSGEQIGSGNYVVYIGSGSYVDVTALSGSVEYHYKAYEYNNSGTDIDYLLSDDTDNPNSQTTPADEPTSQAGDISFSLVQKTQMKLTCAKGNGASRIIVAHSASAVDAGPSDAATYLSSTVFGSGQEIGTGNYVVYNGTDSVVTITGLTAGVTYHFKVYEFNSIGGTNYKVDGFSGDNPNSQITVKDSPSDQADNLSFSNITETAMRVSWTNGDGDGTVVLAHSGSAVDANPADAASYTANTNFGSGDQIGSGNYVVYNGTGSYVDVAALSSNTTYHYKAYEYNNSGSDIDYLISDDTDNPNSQITLKSEPSTQATTVNFTSVKNNQMIVNWTRGDGDSVVVLAHSGSVVDSNPVDAATYTANTAFGSGSQIGTGNYVVYNGTGTNVTVTALTGNTTYHFRVYEYSNSGSQNYKTDVASGNPNSQLTLKDAPTDQADNVVFSSVLTTSMTVSWSNGNGDSSIVLVKESGAVDSDPVDASTYTANTVFESGQELGTGNYVVYSGSGSSVGITGLTAGTTYHVKVYEYNNSGANTDYLTSDDTDNPNSQTTLASEPSSQASNIVFSSVDNDRMTLTWTNGNGANRIVLAHAASVVDGDPVDASTYTANAAFGSGSAINTDCYVVYSGSSNSVTVTGLSSQTTYHYKVYEYSGTSSPNYKVDGFPSGDNPSSKQTLKGTPSDQADNLVFSSVLATSMTVSWSNGDGDNTIVLVKSGTAVDATPSDGSEYTANAAFGSGQELGTANYTVYSGSGSSVNITGLTAGTTYHVKVFEFNNTTTYTNYNTSDDTDNPASNSTTIAEPSTQTGDVSFTSVGATQFTANVNKGNGDYRIFLVRSGSAVDGSPADATTYTANAAFGSGDVINVNNYVVYAGADSFVTVTGLSESVTYHVKVFEYSGSGTTINYKVDGFSGDNPNSLLTSGTTTWLGNSSAWALAGNWSGGSIPTSGIDVSIPSAVSNKPIISSAASCNNLTIQASAGLTVNDATTLTVSGDLLIQATTDGQGALVLKTNTAIASVSGTSTVQVFFNGTTWHYFSTPMTSTSVNSFNGFFVKKYTEGTGWANLVKDDPIEVGRAYTVKFSTASSHTVDLEGTLNTGTQSYNVTKTGEDGWHMVANPYASPIDWGTDADPVTGWNNVNIDKTIFYYDGTQYASFSAATGASTNGGTRIIPACQGIFILASAAGKVEMDNRVRLHDTKSYWKKKKNKGSYSSSQQIMKLAVSGNGYSDEIAVIFHENGTDSLDDNYDAVKWNSYKPEIGELYMETNDGTELVINTISELKYDVDIKIGINILTAGDYIIHENDFTGINANAVILLEDLQEGTVINLRDSSYTFYSDVTKTIDRFMLKVSPPAVIVSDPSEKEMCEGNSISLDVESYGSNVVYQWQTDNGNGWTNLINDAIYSGVNSTNITLLTAPASLDGNRYRCFVSNQSGIDTSSSALLTVSKTPIIESSLDAVVKGCMGTTAIISIDVNVEDVTYLWEYNNGTDWNTLSDDASYSGTSTNVVSLNGIDWAEDGYMFKCRVENSCGNDESEVYTLNVDSIIVISEEPLSLSVCEGDDAVFSILTSGSNSTQYQWEYFDGTSWTGLQNSTNIIGADDADLLLKNLDVTSSIIDYRCVLENQCGLINSQSAGLKVDAPALIEKDPHDSTALVSTSVEFSVEYAGAETMSFMWEEKTDSTWTQIDNSFVNYSGEETNVLKIDQLELTQNGNSYHCIVSNSCGVDTSNAAELSVLLNIGIENHESNLSVYSVNNIVFVKNTGVTTVDLELFDVLGRNVYSESIIGNNKEIQLNVPVGTYMLRYICDNKVQSMKVIITN